MLAENKALSAEQHKNEKRVNVLEHKYRMLMSSLPNIDLSDVLSPEDMELYNEIKASIKDFKKEMAALNVKNTLPSSHVSDIDWLLSYYSIETAKKNITFDVNINGDIKRMVNQVVSLPLLETVMSDHLRNAVIAVSSGGMPARCISVDIGIASEYYEITIHDSGVAFEINTLMRLGKERITTHSAAGGSGIGFMTTFGILRKINASLIIREHQPNSGRFTKSVTIRFDGLGEYTIATYRKWRFPWWQRKGVNIINLRVYP